MNSHSRADIDRMIRRHRRLSIDYQDLTHTWLAAHSNQAHRVERAVYGCLKGLRRQFLPHYFSSAPRWRLLVRQFIKERALPDFCIIGPPKSGTSDLAIAIMSHPNVLHPLVKEFHFKNSIVLRQYYPTRRAVQHHSRRHGAALCPLVAPCLHNLDTMKTLSDLRPTTKIVINLRNPVDLVFSLWKWLLLHRDQEYIDRLPFLATFPAFVDKALELFPEIPAPFNPGLHCGIYATSVAHWLRAFGEANVRIFDVTEYFNDRNAYFESLQRFLGLPIVALPPGLPVANRNPLEGLAPSPEASAKLMEFFEPYNRRLWEVIGTTYPWCLSYQDSDALYRANTTIATAACASHEVPNA